MCEQAGLGAGAAPSLWTVQCSWVLDWGVECQPASLFCAGSRRPVRGMIRARGGCTVWVARRRRAAVAVDQALRARLDSEHTGTRSYALQRMVERRDRRAVTTQHGSPSTQHAPQARPGSALHVSLLGLPTCAQTRSPHTAACMAMAELLVVSSATRRVRRPLTLRAQELPRAAVHLYTCVLRALARAVICESQTHLKSVAVPVPLSRAVCRRRVIDIQESRPVGECCTSVLLKNAVLGTA